jgi:hypothetical protein
MVTATHRPDGSGTSARVGVDLKAIPSASMSRDERERLVAALSRRVAHASHALLVSAKENGMPVTSAEVMIYDEESFSVVQTSRSLVEAHRRGLAIWSGKYWVPTPYCHDLEGALEERYLRETEYM